MNTVTGRGPASEPPQPTPGCWNALIRALTPAFYAPSWAPWLRLTITLVLVFAAYMVTRLM